MARVLGHLYEKTTLLSQPHSHLLRAYRVLMEADLEGGILGRFFRELPGRLQVSFILSLGLCFPLCKRTWFSGAISLGNF